MPVTKEMKLKAADELNKIIDPDPPIPTEDDAVDEAELDDLLKQAAELLEDTDSISSKTGQVLKSLKTEHAATIKKEDDEEEPEETEDGEPAEDEAPEPEDDSAEGEPAEEPAPKTKEEDKKMPTPTTKKPAPKAPTPKKKPVPPVKETNKFGHVLGTRSEFIDKLLIEGGTMDSMTSKLGKHFKGNMMDVKKAKGRILMHIQHLKNEKKVNVTETKDGKFKIGK